MKRILAFLMTLSIMLPYFPAISFAEDFEGVTFYSNTDKTQLESLDDVSEVYAEVSFEATADSATVVVAHYDYSGLLTKTEFINQIDTEDGQNITYTTPSFSVADSDIVKVFAWDGINSMKPLLKTPGVIAKSVPLPTATATTLDTASISVPLTFAMNFKADPATEEQLAYYGSWYADFVLTVNKDITYNADGSADGYLAGQYDSWSENWLAVPNKTYEVKADTPVKIMESAAAIYGKKGLKYTYREVYEKVKDFDCGVFFNKEFLTENPDLKATLELRIYNTKNADESYRIGENYEFTLPNAPAGETVLTAGKVTAVVPSGVILENGTDGLKLTTKSIDDSQSGISADENEKLTSYDIHIDGVSKNNTTPIIITFPQAADKGLNKGNLSLYHVENGKTVAMEEVNSTEELTKHNQFNYEPLDGTVTLALATFSEIALVADTNKEWEGNYDYSWYTNAVATVDGDNAENYIIANADQLAGFGAIVGGMNGQTKDSFEGKTVTLNSNINLGDKDNENESLIFHPIGYYYTDDKNADGTTGDYYSTVRSFEGKFDGNGNTISNFYQNTWEIKGDYDANYYSDAMGLFGYVVNGTVKNLTVDNFSSDGEFTPTGVIAAYASNSTFENIAITNCNPRVYNTGNGGIVGIGGNSDDDDSKKLIFKNITVDNSNKISALWGSWDVACGGLMGMFRGDGLVDFTNCHVSAQIDVYNDVCANYQYYAYRYAGMMIGSIRKNATIDGHVYPNMDGITASDCTVHFGDWNDYYYCELVANSLASYTHDHQFSRLTQVKGINGKTITYLDETKGTVPDSGRVNYVVVNGKHATENATCYHFVDGEVWNHVDAGKETVNGVEVFKEDNQHIYLEFNQLFTGYGWGVTSKGLTDFVGIEKMDITHSDNEESVKKFNAKVKDGTTYTAGTTVTIGDLFEAVAKPDVEIKGTNVQVTVSPADETSTVTGTYIANTDDWTQGKLTFAGTGTAKVTITDYYFCTPTTITVTVTEKKDEVKFEKKFTGDFLYRVGNNGRDKGKEYDVTLGDLFKEKNGATIGTVSVTIEAVDGTGATGTPDSATYSKDSWATGTIDFNGTGIVKVTIKDNNFCIPTELYLEVVDAVNATGATSATANNVVLLNDCGFSSLDVKNGYTLYGNGFSLTCENDSKAVDMSYAFVTVSGGTLDNVKITVPNFSNALLYQENYTQNDNPSETDSSGRTRYGNIRSAVRICGNSKITNSYISGGRAAVYAAGDAEIIGGNVLIENSTIKGGASANIQIGSVNHLTLKDVTLVQLPIKATVNDTSKTLMGLSVLAIADDNGNTSPVTIEGKLRQYAWANSSYKTYVPSKGQSLVDSVLDKENYIHEINYPNLNNQIMDSVNLGFAYIPYVNGLTTLLNDPVINDNRTDKENIPYSWIDESGAEIYTYENTKGTDSIIATEPDVYVASAQGTILPKISYNDNNAALTFETKYKQDTGWNSNLTIDLDIVGTFNLDFNKLIANKYGNNLNYAVKDINGNSIDKSSLVNFNGADIKSYTLVITDNMIYDSNANIKETTSIIEHSFTVTATKTSIPAPVLSGVANQEAIKNTIRLVDSKGGDWRPAYPALQGVTVTFWRKSTGKETFDLSTIFDKGTISTETWTYDDDDFTLTIVGGVIHSGSGTTIRPIVSNNTLYFASTAKEFTTDTTTRNIVLTYTFTDKNNGTDSKTMNKSVEYSSLSEYSYSAFKNGKLEAPSGSSNPTCLAEGTQITLADGNTRAVEDLRKGDKVMSYDHITGKITTKDVIIVVRTSSDFYYKNTFVFDDGTELATINEHGIYDLDLKKYVNIDHINYSKFIGHRFVSVDSKGNVGIKKLTDVICETGSGYKYDIVTEGTLNYVAEDTLSVTHVLVDVINSFDFADGLIYDKAKMYSDIETYGLYGYDEWEEYCDISVFEQYNIPVMKVGISKGLYTKDYIIGLINTYVLDDSVQIID